jgi:hypothetical protein
LRIRERCDTDFFPRINSAGSVFDNELVKKLKEYAPQVNPTPIRLSVTAIYTLVPPQYRGAVVHAYAKAVCYLTVFQLITLAHFIWLQLNYVYLIGIVASVLGSLCAFLVAYVDLFTMFEVAH